MTNRRTTDADVDGSLADAAAADRPRTTDGGDTWTGRGSQLGGSFTKGTSSHNPSEVCPFSAHTSNNTFFFEYPIFGNSRGSCDLVTN